MKFRAAIFDLYNTLLEVGPAPDDVEACWQKLWQGQGRQAAPMLLQAFDEKARELITAQNNTAKERGISFPEVYWPEIARKVAPELTGLPESALDDFLFEHARLQRTVRIAPAACEVLTMLIQQNVLLGLCSNCQPYTLRELSSALSSLGLASRIFTPHLCFYSFQAGFSKPDPKVFDRLKEALATIGIALNEAIMIGDRLDNDILPAKAQGWLTWHLNPNTTEKPGGGWDELARELFA